MSRRELYWSYNFVMTKLERDMGQRGDDKRCRWCRHVLAMGSGPGRPKEFCSQRCRQWDWVARQRATELALSENELVIARDELDVLKDQLYVLHCAIRDARADLASGRQTKDSLFEIINWLIDAADPVAESSLLPSQLRS